MAYYGPGSGAVNPYTGQLNAGYSAPAGYQATPTPGAPPQGGAYTWGQFLNDTVWNNGSLIPGSPVNTYLPDGSILRGTVDPSGGVVGTVTSWDGKTTQQGRFGVGTGGITGAQTTDGGDGDAKLEQQRQLAFGSLNQGANYFGGAMGQQAQQSYQQGMAGQAVPYTQAVQDRLFSSAAATIGAGRESEMDLIRQRMANNGMAGGGGELAMMLAAGRNANAGLVNAQSQIQNNAQLENFGAMERAREGAGQFLTNRSAAEAPYRLKEADLRSRFEVTGQSPTPGLFSGTGVVGNPGYQGGAVRAGGQMGFQTGASGGVGGTGVGIMTPEQQAAARPPVQGPAGTASPAAKLAPANSGPTWGGPGALPLGWSQPTTTPIGGGMFSSQQPAPGQGSYVPTSTGPASSGYRTNWY